MSKLKHPYDTPGLFPREWMLAVMHDPSVPLSTRCEVAVHILKLDKELGNLDDPTVPTVTITVARMPEAKDPEARSKLN